MVDGEAWLFGEGRGGFVLGGDAEEIDRLVGSGLAVRIGEAGGETIAIRHGGDELLTISMPEATASWRSLSERMGG